MQLISYTKTGFYFLACHNRSGEIGKHARFRFQFFRGSSPLFDKLIKLTLLAQRIEQQPSKLFVIGSSPIKCLLTQKSFIHKHIAQFGQSNGLLIQGSWVRIPVCLFPLKEVSKKSMIRIHLPLASLWGSIHPYFSFFNIFIAVGFFLVVICFI